VGKWNEKWAGKICPCWWPTRVRNLAGWLACHGNANWWSAPQSCLRTTSCSWNCCYSWRRWTKWWSSSSRKLAWRPGLGTESWSFLLLVTRGQLRKTLRCLKVSSWKFTCT
jgi:hypothetical protein